VRDKQRLGAHVVQKCYRQSVRMPLASIYDDKSRNLLRHKAFWRAG